MQTDTGQSKELLCVSRLLQGACAWEQEVARVSMSGMSSTAEELLRLASAGQRVITMPQARHTDDEFSAHYLARAPWLFCFVF